MADHGNDEPMQRLRSSDPATGSHPDLQRLRGLIGHRAPASQRLAAGAGADTATGIDDDLMRGPRVRGPWIAAAAVAALGVGVGGYALGQQQGEGTIIVADNALSPAAAERADSLTQFGVEPGLSTSMSVTEDSEMTEDGEMMAYDAGPVRLSAGPELSTERTTGQVSALVATQSAEEFLDSWSEASGFEGTRLPDDSDFFGGGGLADGDSGVVMTVWDETGALSVNYADLFRDEYCLESYTMMQEEGGEEYTSYLAEEWNAMFGPDVPLPTAESCVTPSGPRPSDDESVALARDFLSDLGIAVEDYTFEAFHQGETDSSYVSVEAWPQGGQQYGPLQAHVTVAPGGVVNAYASLGEMTSLGEYQVISPVEAVQRYAVREFSMEYGVSLPEDHAPIPEPMEFVEPDWPEPVAVETGMKLPLLLKDKIVVDAELVQGTLWTEAGSMEVPTWRLVTEDGMSYPVMALADEEIDWRSWG